jgi:hypothetical protein
MESIHLVAGGIHLSMIASQKRNALIWGNSRIGGPRALDDVQEASSWPFVGGLHPENYTKTYW